MTRDPGIVRQLKDRGVFDAEGFAAWLDEHGHSWQQLDRGELGMSLEEAVLLYTMIDPVRWCEAFMVEPDTGEPYRFFGYQRESIRAWDQDVLHQDGAEVGKTREIVALILWGACTSMGCTVPNPWMLIGAPQQTHLDEIILAVEEQMGAQEGGNAKGSPLSAQWVKPKRTPHVMHRIVAPNPVHPERPSIARIYYRPAGHDGEAFRGVHVNALALMDEAAKLKNKLQVSEFQRALKPGCRARWYSVPDGDRDSEFYRMSQQAVPNLPRGQPGLRLFHWPKTIMPAPFWSDARDAEFVRRYGGRHTPGYIRNVLGEHGQQENPVWPWAMLEACVQAVPEYRCITLNADNERGELGIDVKRVTVQHVEGRKQGGDDPLLSTVQDLAPFLATDTQRRRAAMRGLLREWVEPRRSGVYLAGADLGESNDPTEIIISESIGGAWRDLLRVKAVGLRYQAQRELIYVLAELFGFTLHWGVDLGSAGTVVVRDLQTLDDYADAHFDDWLSGFQFAGSVDCIGEDGEALIETAARTAAEKIIRAPAKHWATQCISARLQRGGYELAMDAEALNAMSNQTAREGTKWPIYSKGNDHHPDARRMQMLRALHNGTEGGSVDCFASGVYHRNESARAA